MAMSPEVYAAQRDSAPIRMVVSQLTIGDIQFQSVTIAGTVTDVMRGGHLVKVGELVRFSLNGVRKNADIADRLLRAILGDGIYLSYEDLCVASSISIYAWKSDDENCPLLEAMSNGAVLDGDKLALEYNNRALLKDQSLKGAHDRAIFCDPRFAEAYYNRGILKEKKLLDQAGALADYSQAIALNPQMIQAYAARSLLERSRRKHFFSGVADMKQVARLALRQKNNKILQFARRTLRAWRLRSCTDVGNRILDCFSSLKTLVSRQKSSLLKKMQNLMKDGKIKCHLKVFTNTDSKKL
jgi:tetratricopeptide (TPR) repeat protein